MLHLMVAKVLHTYRQLKDVKNGQPLFNKSIWKSAKNILTLIQNGYLSDLPGIAYTIRLGLMAKMVVYLSTGVCMAPT